MTFLKSSTSSEPRPDPKNAQIIEEYLKYIGFSKEKDKNSYYTFIPLHYVVEWTIKENKWATEASKSFKKMLEFAGIKDNQIDKTSEKGQNITEDQIKKMSVFLATHYCIDPVIQNKHSREVIEHQRGLEEHKGARQQPL